MRRILYFLIVGSLTLFLVGYSATAQWPAQPGSRLLPEGAAFLDSSRGQFQCAMPFMEYAHKLTRFTRPVKIVEVTVPQDPCAGPVGEPLSGAIVTATRSAGPKTAAALDALAEAMALPDATPPAGQDFACLTYVVLTSPVVIRVEGYSQAFWVAYPMDYCGHPLGGIRAALELLRNTGEPAQLMIS